MRALALLCVALAVGCGSSSEASEDLAWSRSAIMRGDTDPDVRSVVAVLNMQTSVICSGVVVSPRAILTARHCVAKLDGGPNVDCTTTGFGEVTEPSQMIVATTTSGAIPDQKHAVVKVITPPENRFCGGDLAVLVLPQALDPKEGTPLPLAGASPAPGEVFTAVGFGRNGDQPSGARRKRDGLRVSCVGDSCRSALIARTEWWGDGAVCEGDSGGPAIDAEGRVVGIASRKREGCTATIYADVASSWSFLSRAVNEAGQTPESRDTAACSAGRSTNASPWIAIVGFAIAAYARGRSKPTIAPPPSRLRA